MTEFKCDRCGRDCHDAFTIRIDKYYKDGRHHRRSFDTCYPIDICQACFDELKGFFNAYGKGALIENDKT